MQRTRVADQSTKYIAPKRSPIPPELGSSGHTIGHHFFPILVFGFINGRLLRCTMLHTSPRRVFLGLLGAQRDVDRGITQLCMLQIPLPDIVSFTFLTATQHVCRSSKRLSRLQSSRIVLGGVLQVLLKTKKLPILHCLACLSTTLQPCNLFRFYLSSDLNT